MISASLAALVMMLQFSCNNWHADLPAAIASSGFILDYSVCALLVQNAVPTLSASDDVSLLQVVLMAAIPTDVSHALIGHELLLLLGWQHRTQDRRQISFMRTEGLCESRLKPPAAHSSRGFCKLLHDGEPPSSIRPLCIEAYLRGCVLS